MNQGTRPPSQIVLLSGGLDSTVNLCLAVARGPVLLALTFDYGQHAAAAEIRASREICARYSLDHRVIPLPWLGEVGASALTRRDQEVPRYRAEELSDPDKTRASARSVWVPNRNGLFLQAAAVLAEAMGADRIVTGFNREEAETFPDNSAAFLEAVNQALGFSTLRPVEVVSYTVDLGKREIVELGLGQGAPLEAVWSCYLGGEIMCGTCESCVRLKRAVAGTRAQSALRGHFVR